MRSILAEAARAGAALGVVCSALVFAASQVTTADQPSNLTRGCIQKFDAAADYFPDKVTLEIAMAFEGRQIRFYPAERSFRWLTGERGRAAVHGHWLRAEMVHVLLERQGYAVAGRGEPSSLAVHIDDSKWTVSVNGTHACGETFRALAAHVRSLTPASEGEES
jgi:hypothetical protein